MSGVFISYRREDSSAYAGRLFDILSARFGEKNIFMDLDTIKGGDNFAAVIEEKVGLCDVLLAVIGDKWVSCTGAGGSRRLDMAGDFVRLEIVHALKRGVRVIPILVGGATMPHPEDLPDDLRPLSLRQAVDLRDAHFRADAEGLIALLTAAIPRASNGPWKAGRRRIIFGAMSLLAVAAVLAGITLWPKQKPAVRANPDSAPPKQVAAANAPLPPAPVQPAGGDQSPKPAARPEDVSGKWKGTVTYDWPGAVYLETFEFDVAGTKLSGTASLLGADRAIFDGKIEGSQISFLTRSLTEFDSKTYQDKHDYNGKIEGEKIRFTLFTDSEVEEHTPVHFTVTRAK
jgi:hypothetical protein